MTEFLILYGADNGTWMVEAPNAHDALRQFEEAQTTAPGILDGDANNVYEMVDYTPTAVAMPQIAGDPARRHKFDMSERQAERLHDLISGHCSAYKNWIASAAESGKLEYAQELVAELRAFEELFAVTNMRAKRDIADYSGRPVETNHWVHERRR